MGAVKNLLFAPTVIPKLSVSFAIGNAGCTRLAFPPCLLLE